jgi:hypothetical protein
LLSSSCPGFSQTDRPTAGARASRLVTNILLQFLCTPRADPKRFEMLSLLSTILGWDEDEREKAGLQRGTGSGYNKGKRKDEVPAVTSPRRSKEDEETFNEVCLEWKELADSWQMLQKRC